MNPLFHLAFPMYDPEATRHFYEDGLGFPLGRSSPQALIFQFGQHQIVAHKVDVLPPLQDGIYPRHFGLIFPDKTEFDAFVARIHAQQLPFHIPLKIRFAGTAIEHHSFFLKDPSNNLLEFKYYRSASAIFGETGYQQVGEPS